MTQATSHYDSRYSWFRLGISVLAATIAGASSSGIGAALGEVKVYVLQPDVEARGMAGKLVDGVMPVDYAGFVDLVAEHPNNQTWL